MFDAKSLSPGAKAACKALHFTPRYWEPISVSNFDLSYSTEYLVLRIWNSRREITLTNLDLDYANRYLR